MEYINEGRAVSIYHGIDAFALVGRCTRSTPPEAQSMAHVASLMDAGEPITCAEWEAAEYSFYCVERRLCRAWEAEFGAPRLNRNGQYYGGFHPALA